MTSPDSDDGSAEPGDLVIWLDEDGVPRVQTVPEADPDEVADDDAVSPSG